MHIPNCTCIYMYVSYLTSSHSQIFFCTLVWCVCASVCVSMCVCVSQCVRLVCVCTCVYVYVLNKCIIYGSTVTISMYIHN